MIDNETIRKVVINKALFPPVTSYAKRTTAGSIVNFETNCEKEFTRFTIGYSYNAEDPQGITTVNVVHTKTTPVDNKISFLPIQEGTGDPSLTNVRPITAPVTITRDDSTTLTVYGGNIDIFTGILTVEWKEYSGTWVNYASSNSYKAYRSSLTDRSKTSTTALCNKISEYGSFSSASMTKNIIQLPVNSVTNFYMALDENEDPSTIQLVYEAYTPDIIQLSRAELDKVLECLGAELNEIDFGATVYGFGLDPIAGTGKVKDIDGVESPFTFTPFNVTTYNGVNNVFLDVPSSSLAIVYLVEKQTDYRYTQQFLPIFYPNTIERSKHHDYS